MCASGANVQLAIQRVAAPAMCYCSAAPRLEWELSVVRRGRTPVARNPGRNQAGNLCQTAWEKNDHRLRMDQLAQPEAAQSLGRRQAPMELNPVQEQWPGDRLGTWSLPAARARLCLAPPLTVKETNVRQTGRRPDNRDRPDDLKLMDQSLRLSLL